MSVYLDGKLSQHFRYKHLIDPLGNSVKDREQLEPLYYQIKNAQFTLEPLEMFLELHPGWTIRPTSFFRSEKENKRVGGSSTSSHRTGEAVDIEVLNPAGIEENKKFVEFIHDRQIPFDQLILFNSKSNPTAIHFGRGKKLRGQYMLYTRQNGYKTILYPY